MAMIMRVDDKLGCNKFHVDEKNPHIQINPEYSNQADIDRLLLACPAGLYRQGDDGKVLFSHEGCLECGTCRVLSGGKVIASWNHPMGGMGINFRYG